MFEDFDQKKIEEDDDSESWSYPSYSRFTFTGKTKSRLGRSSRQNRQPNNKEEMKDNGNLTSEFGSTSSQVPKTPNNCGDWPKNDNFTSSSQYTHPMNGLDHKSSVNDSGVDVSSQSNFFFSLKNDSVQNNSNCKRTLLFNNTILNTEESKSNDKPEQNQLIKLPPISKLKFPFEENKENAPEEKLSKDLNSKEKISFDPSWSQFKRICDGNIPFAPITTKPLQVNEFPTNEKTNFRRTAKEPSNPSNIFNLMGVKENDDQYNTPLDLSSGDSLTNKTFNRSITGGTEHTPVSSEITSSTYPQTLIPQQATEKQLKSDDRMAPKNYSEDINSILPAFLVPTNKNRLKDSCSTEDKSKNSPLIVNNSQLNLNTESKTYLISHPTLTPSIEDPSNADGHDLNVKNYSDKQNPISAVECPPYKYYAIPKPSEVVDGHSMKEPFKPMERINSDPNKYTEPNIHAPQPVDNFLSRRESFIRLQTQNHPLVTQFENLKTREEDRKITPHASNDPNSNLFERIPFAKPTNILQVEPSLSVSNQPENLAINNINQVHNQNQPKEFFSLTPSNNTVNKQIISEKKKSPPFQNSLPDERKHFLSNKPILQRKTEASEINVHIAETPPSNIQHPKTLAAHPQEIKHPLNSAANIQNSELAQEEKLNPKVYQPTQHPPSEAPLTKQPSSDPIMRQNSIQGNSSGCQSEMLHSARQPAVVNHQPDRGQGNGQGYQKTYLAPHAPVDQRNSHNFPHVKPEVPSHQNRPHFPAPKKPQNAFKMPGAQGLLSRGNAELYVNDKTYTILSMLGRGGSSEVYQVLDPRSSKLMAVKCVDLSMVDKTIADGYLNEIDLLSKLQGCASVIRMFDYEYVEENKMLYVVMEKGDTDLSQLIRDISKTKKISMSMIIYYWTEMLNAVKDIHEQGIIHSDLKPANFLLVSGRLKLIDFGIASSQGDMTSVVKEVTTGTWNYMSPEAIRNTSSNGKGFKITYKSDVWSLGCILYNLVYGKTPFSHITNTWGKLQAIADANHRIEFPDVGAPVVLAGALRSCFHRDPKQRPTVAELMRLQYHATCDTNHIGRQLLNILPAEWWARVSHLFPEVKQSQEVINPASSTA